MLKKLVSRDDRFLISKQVITGALIGGILGAVIGFWHRNGVLTIPVLWSIFEAIPISSALTGTLLGIFVGGGLGTIWESHVPIYNSDEHDSTEYSSNKYCSYINTNNSSEQVINDTNNEVKLQLREELLDISKERIKTAEVDIHKEVFIEEKTITVPITHEELVIKKKIFAPKNSDETDEHMETIRIPISEERIEIIKHPIIIEDFSVYTHKYQEIQCIDETLRKEKLRVESTGEAKVINKAIK